jgi:hypothetical protein
MMCRRVKASSLHPPTNVAAGIVPGTADNEPAELADKAGVSRPAPVGDLGGCPLSVRRLFRHPRTFRADEPAIPGLHQEPGVDQRPEQRRANVAFEAPEPPGLSRSQTQTRHFHELSLHPLENFIDTHVSSPVF